MATIVTSFSFAVRETQSLRQQMLNAPLGINGLTAMALCSSGTASLKLCVYMVDNLGYLLIVISFDIMMLWFFSGAESLVFIHFSSRMCCFFSSSFILVYLSSFFIIITRSFFPFNKDTCLPYHHLIMYREAFVSYS